jgi:hypothetical protein
MSVRLHVVVEGQTEETYTNRVLKQHLADLHVFVDVRVVETGRRRGRVYRGGIRTYAKLRGDLVKWMKQDDQADVFFTTMVDVYGLRKLSDTFPGWEEADAISDPYAKVSTLEKAWKTDVQHPRFIPYLQLHEFEALLLASPQHLGEEFIGYDEPILRLADMASQFDSPEYIDDGEDTAPSKRIIAELPQYAGRKATAGPITAERIGLENLRPKCLHFDRWLKRLESLSETDHP